MRMLTATRNEAMYFLRSAQIEKIRSMRNFAEEEIVIPDGPYEGRRFSVDRQPYTGIWFDAIDTGQWNRYVATGPTQSGKTLCSFVIPTMYHLFEVGENVICGLPDMDMAADKWREDFLPAIQRSRYRELLPRKGRGSKGGKTETISFLNGATLKFMSGGGGDKSRAGFTSRVVVITETDGMDKASATSREADPISQLEARTRAYGGSKKIYMECTVSTERGRTWYEYSEVGTASNIHIRCSYCERHVRMEREDLIGWKDAATQHEAEMMGAFHCPNCGERWSEEDRHQANRDLQLVHKGQELTPEGEITGEAKISRTLGFRWSAAHNQFLSQADIAGDEWKALRAIDEDSVEREMCQFVWAIPYVPPLESEDLRADQIIGRTHPNGRGAIPKDTTHITVGVDVGKWLGWYTVIAWQPDFQAWIIDYGSYEIPTRELGQDNATDASLRQLIDRMQEEYAPDLLWIDAGYQTQIVYKICRESPKWVEPVMGYGYNQRKQGRYNAPKERGQKHPWIGEEMHGTTHRAKGIILAEVNADYWKSNVHRRLVSPPDVPGSILLCEAPRSEHLQFARHVTAERAVEGYDPDLKRTVQKWEQVHDGNHLLDSTYYAIAADHAAGIRIRKVREIKKNLKLQMEKNRNA